MTDSCFKAPAGWRCTRASGHDGPCAAVPPVSQLRASTKSLVGLVVTLAGLFQVPQVHDALIAFEHAHPHWSGAIGGALAIAALLHNPQVQKALGIDCDPSATS